MHRVVDPGALRSETDLGLARVVGGVAGPEAGAEAGTQGACRGRGQGGSWLGWAEPPRAGRQTEAWRELGRFFSVRCHVAHAPHDAADGARGVRLPLATSWGP